MSELLRGELRKSVANTFFKVALAFGLLLIVTHIIYMAGAWSDALAQNQMLADYEGHAVPMNHGATVYNRWISLEGYTLQNALFYFLFPLLAASSYGWSYFMELKSGYVKNVVVRAGKRNYFLAKYLATFAAGGLVVLIPLAVDFLAMFMIFPAYPPNSLYSIYYSVFGTTVFADLFYTAPLIYVLIYMILNFLFGGLAAVMSFAIAFFVRNRFAVVLFPFFLFLVIEYISRSIDTSNIEEEIFSPWLFLQAGGRQGNFWIDVGYLLAFFVATFAICMGRGIKDEVL